MEAVEYMTPEQIKKMQSAHVLVLGDFMLDNYIIGDVQRISPEAPVPIIEVRSESVRLGGAGNVVHNIRTLGAEVRILCCVGDDKNGAELVSALENLGADIQYLKREAEVTTIVKTRVVSKNQQFLRFDREEINDIPVSYIDFVKEHIGEIFTGIDIVVISDYGKGTVSPPLSQLLIAKAKELGVPVLVDPKGKDYTKYAGATVCTPNLGELSMVAGKTLSQKMEDDIRAAALQLCDLFGFAFLIVTRSEMGISLVRGDGVKKDYPALKKEVVDVSGAGDTVITVIALGMAAGFPLEECCQLANTAASIVVSKFGTAVVTFNELVGSEMFASVGKLLKRDQVPYLIDFLREHKKRVVFTNGCFDILHAGHISSFEQARAFGEVLIVGLNSDMSVRRIKGDKRPIVNERDRARVLQSLTVIDYIVLFDEDTPEALIREISPDVLVKGKDWEGMVIAGQAYVESYGGTVEFIDLEQGLSTTRIIEKILDVYGNTEDGEDGVCR